MKKKLTTKTFIILSLMAFTIKLPFALSYLRLYPDSIAYLNIARNFAHGNGFISTLKLNFFCPSSVNHCALSDWPPLYPVLAGMILQTGLPELVLQIANALAASLAAGFVFLIGKKLFDQHTGIAAGILTAIAPNLFRSGISPLSDALGLVLALAAIVIALYAEDRKNFLLAAGIITGLACLTRFPNGIMLIAITLFLIIQKKKLEAAIYLAGFAIIEGPVFLCKWLIYGSPFYSVQLYHYSTASFHNAIWSGTGNSGSLSFLKIITAIARNLLYYTFDLLIGLRGLFLLSIGMILFFKKQAVNIEQRFVLSIAIFNLLVYALTWAIPPVKGSRFLLLSFCLLLPFCITGLYEILESEKEAFRRAGIGICAAVIGVYLWGCFTAAVSLEGQFQPLRSELTQKLKDMVPANTAVASNNPWMISYSTNQPAIILPNNLNRHDLTHFIRQYEIGAIVIFKSKHGTVTADTIQRSNLYILHLKSATVALTNARYGQKAYDGTWNMMPQIVQKLPTTHSASMAPRKNGSARL